RIPLRRILTLWFTPRVELLPISGTLWPIRQQFRNDPADFSVTVLLGALNLLYVGLAVAGFTRGLLYRQRAPGDDANGWNPLSPAYVLLAVFILVRTIFFTTVETPEPRYVLECFPAIFVLGAMTWLSRPAAHSNAS